MTHFKYLPAFFKAQYFLEYNQRQLESHAIVGIVISIELLITLKKVVVANGTNFQLCHFVPGHPIVRSIENTHNNNRGEEQHRPQPDWYIVKEIFQVLERDILEIWFNQPNVEKVGQANSLVRKVNLSRLIVMCQFKVKLLNHKFFRLPVVAILNLNNKDSFVLHFECCAGTDS
jgi:hypothetical protein